MVRYSIIEMKKGDLIASGARTISPTKIFVAYRFDSVKSKQFRQELEIELKKSESLKDIKVIDGHVSLGEHWLREIRNRLRTARLVIADVTALSPEVLFECGFAWGMNKTIMPVVEDRNFKSKLPQWLTDLQIGIFSSSEEMAKILDSIGKNLSKSIGGRRHTRIPKPIPGKIVWLSGVSEFEQYRENLAQTACRFELELPEKESPPSLDEVEETLINEIAEASLMIASLTNSPSDPFIHFSTGVIVSKPMAGESSKKLRRRVILAIPDSLHSDDVVSDSARRCTTSVRVVKIRQLNSELLNFGKSYKKYIINITTR